jgi:perosamine synthetase
MNLEPIYLSYPCLRGNEQAYVVDCLKSEWISTSGTYVSRFEQAVVGYVGTPGAVACVNGTAALHVCLLLAGVQPGEEVIVPTLTFIAPVNTVRYVNAEPVFMDCDEYLNLDVQKLETFLETECTPADQGVINRTTGRRIRAVIPVHVFGSLCDMERLMAAAAKYRLIVIEDATEALGSKLKMGDRRLKIEAAVPARQAPLSLLPSSISHLRSPISHAAGAIGDFGCYSFNGNKIITCGGGGMIVARSPELLARAKYLTTQAKNDDLHYVHDEVGYNYRLTAIQAAMGLAQMEQLPGFIETKRKRYLEYKERIGRIPGLCLLGVPPYCESNYWFYSLVIDEKVYGIGRDALLQRFEAARIQARPIWKLNHTQKPYRQNQAYQIEKAPVYFDSILNIPCSVGLTDEEMERVVAVLQQGG